MNAVGSLRIYFFLSSLIFGLTCRPATAHLAATGAGASAAISATGPAPTTQSPAGGRDGQHDFDFNLGTYYEPHFLPEKVFQSFRRTS